MELQRQNKDNHPISGLHITDLINTAVSNAEKNKKTLIKSFNIPERLLGHGPQFDIQEEVWKPEPESQSEWELEW